MITKTYLFNTVLVHVARTWERIRVEQPHQWMGYDNIESVDEIVTITDSIMEDQILKKFLIPEEWENWDWDRETGEGCSDIYIENLANKIIFEDYLDN
jgi:hypothetical protein